MVGKRKWSERTAGVVPPPLFMCCVRIFFLCASPTVSGKPSLVSLAAHVVCIWYLVFRMGAKSGFELAQLRVLAGPQRAHSVLFSKVYI